MKICFSLFLLLICSLANALDFKEGIDYVKLDTPVVGSEKKLIEFYNFACVYCFRAGGGVKVVLSKLPSDMTFERIPVVLGKGERFRTGAEIAYVAESAGLMHEYYDYIFQVTRAPISWEQKKYNYISSRSDAKIFFADLGVSDADFDKYLEQSKAAMENDNAFAKSLNLAGTPTFLIKGKYMVSGLKSVPYNERRLANLIFYILDLPESP
jgi:thiol:disulfide interchange protein DsbA